MLATVCGYTPAEIDQIDMSDFEMLSEYWSSHPPVHLMVAGYLGIKPRQAEPSEDFAQILSTMPGWSKRMH